MPRQITTALSDAVLALSVLHFIYRVVWINFFAALALSTQGVAAGIGTVRFIMSNPDPILKEYHQLSSLAAQIIGLPLLGIAFAHNVMPTLVALNFVFITVAGLAYRFAEPPILKLITEATSGFGMLTIVLSSVKSINIFGLAGVVLYVSAGLAIGSEGYLNGIPRVDLLHYVLAVGNEFFLLALVTPT